MIDPPGMSAGRTERAERLPFSPLIDLAGTQAERTERTT